MDGAKNIHYRNRLREQDSVSESVGVRGAFEQYLCVFPLFSPDDDSVIDGEGVGGEAGDVPGADRHLVAEDLDQVELGRAGDALVADVLHPGADLVLAEGRREGAEVGHLSGGDQDVARQVRVLERQVLRLLRPSVTQQQSFNYSWSPLFITDKIP